MKLWSAAVVDGNKTKLLRILHGLVSLKGIEFNRIRDFLSDGVIEGGTQKESLGIKKTGFQSYEELILSYALLNLDSLPDWEVESHEPTAAEEEITSNLSRTLTSVSSFMSSWINSISPIKIQSPATFESPIAALQQSEIEGLSYFCFRWKGAAKQYNEIRIISEGERAGEVYFYEGIPREDKNGKKQWKKAFDERDVEGFILDFPAHKASELKRLKEEVDLQRVIDFRNVEDSEDVFRAGKLDAASPNTLNKVSRTLALSPHSSSSDDLSEEGEATRSLLGKDIQELGQTASAKAGYKKSPEVDLFLEDYAQIISSPSSLTNALTSGGEANSPRKDEIVHNGELRDREFDLVSAMLLCSEKPSDITEDQIEYCLNKIALQEGVDFSCIFDSEVLLKVAQVAVEKPLLKDIVDSQGVTLLGKAIDDGSLESVELLSRTVDVNLETKIIFRDKATPIRHAYKQCTEDNRDKMIKVLIGAGAEFADIIQDVIGSLNKSNPLNLSRANIKNIAKTIVISAATSSEENCQNAWNKMLEGNPPMIMDKALLESLDHITRKFLGVILPPEARNRLDGDAFKDTFGISINVAESLRKKAFAESADLPRSDRVKLNGKLLADLTKNPISREERIEAEKLRIQGDLERASNGEVTYSSILLNEDLGIGLVDMVQIAVENYQYEPDQDGVTLLGYAIREGNEEAVNLIIKSSVPINDVTVHVGETYSPIKLAAKKGRTNIVKALIEGGVEFADVIADVMMDLKYKKSFNQYSQENDLLEENSVQELEDLVMTAKVIISSALNSPQQNCIKAREEMMNKGSDQYNCFMKPEYNRNLDLETRILMAKKLPEQIVSDERVARGIFFTPEERDTRRVQEIINQRNPHPPVSTPAKVPESFNTTITEASSFTSPFSTWKTSELVKSAIKKTASYTAGVTKYNEGVTNQLFGSSPQKRLLAIAVDKIRSLARVDGRNRENFSQRSGSGAEERLGSVVTKEESPEEDEVVEIIFNKTGKREIAASKSELEKKGSYTVVVDDEIISFKDHTISEKVFNDLSKGQTANRYLKALSETLVAQRGDISAGVKFYYDENESYIDGLDHVRIKIDKSNKSLSYNTVIENRIKTGELEEVTIFVNTINPTNEDIKRFAQSLGVERQYLENVKLLEWEKEIPSPSPQTVTTEKIAETTLYKPLSINQKSIWKDDERGNKLKVVNGVYGLNDEDAQDEIEQTLINIIITVAADPSLNMTLNQVLLVIEESRKAGGISNKWLKDEDVYKGKDELEFVSGVSFATAKKFSKMFQKECDACGILSGRKGGKEVGLRTSFIPKTVTDTIEKEASENGNGPILLRDQDLTAAKANLETRRSLRDGKVTSRQEPTHEI